MKLPVCGGTKISGLLELNTRESDLERHGRGASGSLERGDFEWTYNNRSDPACGNEAKKRRATVQGKFKPKMGRGAIFYSGRGAVSVTKVLECLIKSLFVGRLVSKSLRD